jgi:hypothetical protein
MSIAAIFTPYALPAVLSLIAKAAIYFYARYSKVHNLQTRLYLLFLFSLSVQNLAELGAFVAKAESLVQPWSGRLYFGTNIFAVVFLLHLALLVGNGWRHTSDNKIPAWGIALLYTPALFLETLLWGTSLLVAGFEPMGYTYTKIPGLLFFLWESYAICYFFVAMGVLVYGSSTRSTAFQRLQNKFLLVGLLPIITLAIAVIVLQRFGFHGFNTTSTLPIAITFFLAVTAHATHQHRLFDIEFFIPWSKTRKRKTEFYRRIQTTMGEIAVMNSVQEILDRVAKILRCQVALLGMPQPIVAPVADQRRGADGDSPSAFPEDALRSIAHIVVTEEIAQTQPELCGLMKRYKIGAIVPFEGYADLSPHWMLLGEHFNRQVYTPLDFHSVEALFHRITDRFLEDRLLQRAELEQLQEENGEIDREIAEIEADTAQINRDNALMEAANRRLREDNAGLRRDRLHVVKSATAEEAPEKPRTLQERLDEVEGLFVEAALAHFSGDIAGAARRLGVSPRTMHHLMQRHRPGEYEPQE